MCYSLVVYLVVFLKLTELGETRTRLGGAWATTTLKKTFSIESRVRSSLPVAKNWVIPILPSSFECFSLLKPQTLSQGRHIWAPDLTEFCQRSCWLGHWVLISGRWATWKGEAGKGSTGCWLPIKGNPDIRSVSYYLKVPHLPFTVSCSLHLTGIHDQTSSELILPGAMRLWHELSNIPSFQACSRFGQESRSIYLARTTHRSAEMTSQPSFLLKQGLANATLQLHREAPFQSELTCWVSLDWPGLLSLAPLGLPVCSSPFPTPVTFVIPTRFSVALACTILLLLTAEFCNPRLSRGRTERVVNDRLGDPWANRKWAAGPLASKAMSRKVLLLHSSVLTLARLG